MSRNVKYKDVKNMDASISRTGKRMSPAKSGMPSKVANVVMMTTANTSTDSHIRPKTARAQKLRAQATKLKNMLLIAGKSCQYTSAGACQNISDSGKCRPRKTHMAA